MKMPILPFFIFLLLFSSCSINTIKGNGKVISKDISTSQYDRIEVLGSIDVVLIKGSEGKLKIEGEENIIELIEATVKGKTLFIGTKSGVSYSTTKPLKITVPVEKITALKLGGSGNITSTSLLVCDHLSLDLDGSGNIKLSLNAIELTSVLNGSGTITLLGETKKLNCTLNGSGNIEAKELKAEQADVNLSGSGDITVHAMHYLNANVDGSGSIRYVGRPGNIVKLVTGSGDIVEI